MSARQFSSCGATSIWTLGAGARFHTSRLLSVRLRGSHRRAIARRMLLLGSGRCCTLKIGNIYPSRLRISSGTRLGWVRSK